MRIILFEDIRNCGEIILRCIIDQIASKQDFIETAAEMLEILYKSKGVFKSKILNLISLFFILESSFCNTLSIRNALNNLKNKYVHVSELCEFEP